MYVWILITDYIDHGRQSSIPDTYILNIIIENDICWFINIVIVQEDINSSFGYIHTYECSIDNRLDLAYLHPVSTVWCLAALVDTAKKESFDTLRMSSNDLRALQDLLSIRRAFPYQLVQYLLVYCFVFLRTLEPNVNQKDYIFHEINVGGSFFSF